MRTRRHLAATTWRPISLLRVCLCLCLVLTAGCTMRSISNTARPYPGQNTTYAGELSDFDVVGRNPTAAPSPPGTFAFRRGARVLVVQSGALFPDEPMLQALAAHFQVASASGIPGQGTASSDGVRGAAQRGGFDAVIAYWGVLEGRTKATADSAVTMWLPIVSMFAVDESQELRLRLRIVVLDTGSGRWQTIEPPPIADERLSSHATRLHSDADQVEALKALGYPRAAEAIVAACTK